VKHTEQSNVEFGYQLSICCGTKENHGDGRTFYMWMMFVPHRRHRPAQCFTGWPYLLYLDDVRTSQETQAPTVCYGNSFTVLYARDVRAS
jgi:hypothetical protein